MTHDLWAALNVRMVDFLQSVTLQKLVDEQHAKGFELEDRPPPSAPSRPRRWSSRSASPRPTRCSRWAA
jgi:hypothetical protein